MNIIFTNAAFGRLHDYSCLQILRGGFSVFTLTFRLFGLATYRPTDLIALVESCLSPTDELRPYTIYHKGNIYLKHPTGRIEYPGSFDKLTFARGYARSRLRMDLVLPTYLVFNLTFNIVILLILLHLKNKFWLTKSLYGGITKVPTRKRPGQRPKQNQRPGYTPLLQPDHPLLY